jgi:hypothetical protein
MSGRPLTLRIRPVTLCPTPVRSAGCRTKENAMASKARASDQPDPRDVEGDADDVEGHNMLVDPSMARNMAAGRSREIERQVRDQQRAREAKTQEPKHR